MLPFWEQTLHMLLSLSLPFWSNLFSGPTDLPLYWMMKIVMFETPLERNFVAGITLPETMGLSGRGLLDDPFPKTKQVALHFHVSLPRSVRPPFSHTFVFEPSPSVATPVHGRLFRLGERQMHGISWT